jgi:gluconate 5-dehydrogenase
VSSFEAGAWKLSGRVAIVTGGGRGLGLDIAKALYAAGAQVAVCGRYPDILSATALFLDSSGARGSGNIVEEASA